MEVIDLTGAERHRVPAPAGPACGCNRTWYQLPDATWLLVAHGQKSGPAAKGLSVRFVPRGNIEGTVRYAAAERIDEPRAHLEDEARRRWKAEHPTRLYPVVGPPVTEILRQLEHAGGEAVMGPDGELLVGVIGKAGRLLDRVNGADLAVLSARIREYRGLIAASLSGTTVACVGAARCKEAAVHLDLLARPLCPDHATSPLRQAGDVPDVTVRLPEPWPREEPDSQKQLQKEWKLEQELSRRQSSRGKYARTTRG